ncbi:WXG100 family type VII secretion target [Streptomyces carminius]|uniref:WXG100 family type VII secretion target n=1 Tax=Streptomyces carminius TaxID=2665496 RepID=UPI00130411DB|nr:hypothetical protein [Streptomyces carminius]
MSDEQQERPDEPNVAPLLVFTDLRRNGMFLPFGLGGAMRAGVMGSTDFEGKDLEEMLDLVEDARPGEIENAANALWDAAGKIKEIGDDLRTHIDRVDWEGEFGDNFRAWGRDLSKNTLVLADYTEQASIHLKAAGAGLATVRSAMPKRDASVLGAPKVEAIPAEERVETNERYKLAKKKEEDRQEAINQMNRLASYYTVSHDNMRASEEPRFGPMPSVGMPPRAPGDPYESPGRRTASVPAEEYRTAEPLPQAQERRESTMVRGTAPEEKHTVLVPDGAPVPGQDVRTDLNTVAPVAPPATDPGPRTPLPATGGGGTGPGPIAPLPPAHNGPLSSSRSGGGGGPRNAGPYQGVRGGTQGPSGGTSNIPPGKGNGLARPVTGAGPISGAPHASQPPVGRPGTGVFGGTSQPQRGGSGSPHIPRGTVVGAEHGTTGRPPVGGATGASAIGAGNNGPGRRQTASAPGGVVGTPRHTPAQGGAARPFTPGGTGLARSGAADGGRSPMGVPPRAGRPSSSQEESGNEARRPDYLTEDEETWTAGRNNTVPPVVD